MSSQFQVTVHCREVKAAGLDELAIAHPQKREREGRGILMGDMDERRGDGGRKEERNW